MKQVVDVLNGGERHWVGDGFPVRSLFEYGSLGKRISPFLLLDHGGPVTFGQTTARRGVGSHPHRGIETVTIVYDGEVAHRDSTGNGGVIGPGDVQWMTAASGILHEEFHSDAFARRGGAFEMVQLWVNLPARAKMTPPGYQAIVAGDIPSVTLPGGAGSLRVIAGAYEGHAGPARTHSPIDVRDLRLNAGRGVELPMPEGHVGLVVVLHGRVRVGPERQVREGQTALLERQGAAVALEALTDAVVLVLGGEPFDEPVVGQGPFVMNTEAEIRQAYADFRAGRFGTMAPEPASANA